MPCEGPESKVFEYDSAQSLEIDLDEIGSWFSYTPNLLAQASTLFDELSLVLEHVVHEQEQPPRASNRSQFYAAGASLSGWRYKANPRWCVGCRPVLGRENLD